MALTYFGETTFTLLGVPEWTNGGFGLDSVILRYSGAETGLNSFLATLTKFSPCPIDGNMFLEDYRVSGGSRAYPEVSAKYIGCKGGTLPPVRRETGTSLQTVTYSIEIADVATIFYEFQYLSPTASSTWIARNPNADGSAATPSGNVKLVFWRIGANSSLTSNNVSADTVRGIFYSIFRAEIVPSYRSDEIVSGRFYQNRMTNTLIYTT